MFFMMVVFTGLAITILSYTVRSPRWHTAVFILGGLAQTGGSVSRSLRSQVLLGVGAVTGSLP